MQEPFGIYVHWPFCAHKCPYCDFNSHVRFNGWDEARYLEAFRRELDWVAALRWRGRAVPVSSIFFGGGTPSLMQPATVGAILEHISRLWPIAPDVEITLEANPGSVEAARFRGFRDAGVNRVSMGLQSLRDEDLRRLGRMHTVDEARAALRIARATFERYSFDLIYARPGQTPAQWRAELAEALTLADSHISLYQLTIEPDTPFAALHAAGKLVVPDPDAAATLFEITQEMTGARGLPAYEISNHAAPGAECRHNLLYWRYGEYAGVGCGAHGRLLATAQHGGAVRTATIVERQPERWLQLVETQGHGFTEQIELQPAEQADEALLMGLRLSDGLAMHRLAAFGVRPSQAVISHLCALGLIETICAPSQQAADAQRLRATPKGRFVLNAVVAELAASFEPATAADPAGAMDIGGAGH